MLVLWNFVWSFGGIYKRCPMHLNSIAQISVLLVYSENMAVLSIFTIGHQLWGSGTKELDLGLGELTDTFLRFTNQSRPTCLYTVLRVDAACPLTILFLPWGANYIPCMMTSWHVNTFHVTDHLGKWGNPPLTVKRRQDLLWLIWNARTFIWRHDNDKMSIHGFAYISAGQFHARKGQICMGHLAADNQQI